MANAQVNTIRLKLCKVAAIVIHNTRRIRFLLPSHYPYQGLFETALNNLNST
ncbi:transposase [Saccharospirillum impatiens]|uniref:transposase n=1 Tax=Saccharospirillum impatiens TaxID=169438 RepID=UPI003CCBFDE5